MKKVLFCCAVGLMVASIVVVQGCKKSEDEPVPEPGVAIGATVDICLDCGQVEGSDICCADDAEKCASCGLAKGSPGCCKIPEGATEFQLCTACGQVKDSDVCCAADAEKCDLCGLAKGSPGCCKLPAK